MNNENNSSCIINGFEENNENKREQRITSVFLNSVNETIYCRKKVYYVDLNLEIKTKEVIYSASIYLEGGNISVHSMQIFDNVHKCYLRETREEAIDDLIAILSERLEKATKLKTK